GLEFRRVLVRSAGRRDRDAEVGGEFLVDVAERRRERQPLTDAEAEAVRLAGAVVRVLAEDQDARVVVRAVPERAEEVLPRRVHRLRLVLPRDERAQRG